MFDAPTKAVGALCDLRHIFKNSWNSACEGMAVYDRDLTQDWAMTRMADAEMGDL